MISSTKSPPTDHADIEISISTVLWAVVAIGAVIFSIILFTSDQFLLAVILTLVAYAPAQKSYESYKTEERRHDTRVIRDLRELTYAPVLSTHQTCQVVIAFEFRPPNAYASTRIQNALQTSLNRTFVERTSPPSYEELENILNPPLTSLADELRLSFWQCEVKYIEPVQPPQAPQTPEPPKGIWS